MPPTQNGPVDPDTLITVKVAFDGENRRFKIPLRDLGAHTFPQRIRQLLNIPSEADIVLQRYSDSAGKYLTLDSDHPPIYKQLYRAAKAKLKLRIQVDLISAKPDVEETQKTEEAEKAEETGNAQETSEPTESPEKNIPERLENSQDTMENIFQHRGSYMETVLGQASPPPGSLCGLSRVPVDTNASPLPSRPKRRAYPSPPTLPANTTTATYSCSIMIDCNHCNASVPNEHYHCSICENGDYDLCPECVGNGVLCPGGIHWLIKRSIIDGKVVNSTTEIVGPKFVQPPKIDEPKPEPVGTWNEDDQAAEQTVEPKLEVASPYNPIAERTCNVCVEVYNVSKMVQCNDCHDFDVCFDCLTTNRGHHNPTHAFSLIEDSGDKQSERIEKYYCQPGGHTVHGAICDDCDSIIIGTRHKCLDCPNWDVCNKCVRHVEFTHPTHRFAPLSDPLPRPRVTHPEVHTGVYCDGSRCQDKMGREYISGVRYKCVVCHDTDFCETCEAHPNNMHNRTHPLLKFKSSVKYVSVSAYGENQK
ncbi:hypothetical protein FQN49_008008, partial [Arthroderma sp. PD_2]